MEKLSRHDGGLESPGKTGDVPMLDCTLANSLPETRPAPTFLDHPCPAVPLCSLEALGAPIEASPPERACGPMALDSLRSATGGRDKDPAAAAAFLHLLGESLVLIGHYLQETDELVSVPTSLSVLLDSLLCTLAPLMSLSSQIPELQGCLEHTLDNTLENVSYLMPGL